MQAGNWASVGLPTAAIPARLPAQTIGSDKQVGEAGMIEEIDNVLQVVADQFGVTVAEIRSHRRSRHVVPARLVAAYLAHELTERTPQDIGRQLGGRDHTNIVMYCRTVARLAIADPAYRQMIEGLTVKCRSTY